MKTLDNSPASDILKKSSITKMMKHIHKSVVADKDGRITIYPAMYANKEKGKLKRMLKRLIQLRKGH